ncbi:hypothetical protein BDM02DRAFT_471342 [Thelephora ganbajun]|uniref:Uncharacterized protein n=1 Tax=Thelephora ganbajun TaxID=370292 RepID=A0ACB6Z7L9_THEGA|nr:hypothetical protein BDM02DRAFT_471342 [Thelephora ganbajun]
MYLVQCDLAPQLPFLPSVRGTAPPMSSLLPRPTLTCTQCPLYVQLLIFPWSLNITIQSVGGLNQQGHGWRPSAARHPFQRSLGSYRHRQLSPNLASFQDRLQYATYNLARPLSRWLSFQDYEHRCARGSQRHYYAEIHVPPSLARTPSPTSLCADPESISRTLARRRLRSHSICAGGVTPHQRANVTGVL